MARDHARMQVSMWDDQDFLTLPASAQHLYFTVATQKRLSYCGVLDYIPTRLARLAKGLTPGKVDAAVKVLEDARFVVLDRATSELLVRTYIRHDRVLERSNMGKAMGKALDLVVSDRIRKAIHVELRRLYADRPDLAGWGGFRIVSPDEFAIALPMASAMQSAEESPVESPTPLPPSPFPLPTLVTSVSQVPLYELAEDGLTRISKALNDCPETHARKCANWVLAKAPTDVRNPTAYVLAAIKAEPEAFAYKRGNPTKRDECPDHPGQWADHCAGCAADRLAVGS